MPYADPVKNRESKRRWAKAQRDEWFAGKVCAHCGAGEKLELDHIDPAQKVSHRIWGLSPARRLPELAKCQALCHSCHAKKTAAQQPRLEQCRRGHPFTPENTIAKSRGRQCRACNTESHRRSARARGVQPSRKNTTHCIHGHAYTYKNTYVTKAGRRRCKACRTADMRRRSKEPFKLKPRRLKAPPVELGTRAAV